MKKYAILTTAAAFATLSVTAQAADTTYYDSGYRSGSPFTYVAPGREFSFNFKAKF